MNMLFVLSLGILLISSVNFYYTKSRSYWWAQIVSCCVMIFSMIMLTNLHDLWGMFWLIFASVFCGGIVISDYKKIARNTTTQSE